MTSTLHSAVDNSIEICYTASEIKQADEENKTFLLRFNFKHLFTEILINGRRQYFSLIP